jgi:hypothetical protein
MIKLLLLVWASLFLVWILYNFNIIHSVNMLLYIPCFIKTAFRSNNFMKITENECSIMNSEFQRFLRS